jgi:hypothetical protein
VRKRRRKTRREPPTPRLDERLTTLDRAALDMELERLIGRAALAQAEPVPREETAAVSVLDSEPAPERPHRLHEVAEAEVVIVRRERGAAAGREHRAPVEAPQTEAAQPHRKSWPASGADGAHRAVFDGVVEEATVVIIRRTPRERRP